MQLALAEWSDTADWYLEHSRSRPKDEWHVRAWLSAGLLAAKGAAPHLAGVREFWRKHSAILGKSVRIREEGRSFTGVVDDVDPIDGVVLRLQHGQIRGFRGERIERLEIL